MVKKYIVDMLETDEGLFSILNGFILESMSQGMGDYVAKRIRRIDKKSLGKFINIDNLDKKINQIDEGSLETEKANVIKLYKNPPKDDFDD
jgi:hypothetical protein